MGKTAALWAAMAACTVSLSFLSATSSEAVTAELARKCRAMALAAYPPQPVGKPYAQLQREYYLKCIANNGNM
jgi:hypothetical protein